ncbi:MAG: AbrB family transcriptional regulator [Roseovarius sp.]
MRHLSVTLALISLGALGGGLAALGRLPLPFLLGPMAAAGTVAIALPHRLPPGYAFPQPLRRMFIAVIGVMIGARVTPDLFAGAGRLAVSFALLALFVLLAHALSYAIFRRLGGYDRVTAFYAASPGGLFESLTMGEAAGADLARLTLQQFLRIITVVSVLPLALSVWVGAPVGSAGGMSLGAAQVPWSALPPALAAALAGAFMGRALRLPAGQLTGPLAVAAALSLSGLHHPSLPQWLINGAQIVVGTALGMRFSGLAPALILRGAGLALLSVGGMLGLAALAALALRPLTGEGFDVLLISFAPGGVTEMALVALSLHANPAFVTLHHVMRILMTVAVMALTGRHLRGRL